MRRLHSFVPALGAGLVLLLAACSSGATAASSAPASASEATSASAAASESTAPAAAGGETVMLADFEFSPAELTIPAGTTVTFMNMDPAPHSATNGSDGEPAADSAFDLRLAASSGTGEFTFDEPGTYQVTCTIHPAMNMTITVE